MSSYVIVLHREMLTAQQGQEIIWGVLQKLSRMLVLFVYFCFLSFPSRKLSVAKIKILC